MKLSQYTVIKDHNVIFCDAIEDEAHYLLECTKVINLSNQINYKIFS